MRFHFLVPHNLAAGNLNLLSFVLHLVYSLENKLKLNECQKKEIRAVHLDIGVIASKGSIIVNRDDHFNVLRRTFISAANVTNGLRCCQVVIVGHQ